MRNKLLGALVGIARAADGNEHLISDSTTSLIIDALTAIAAGTDLNDLMQRAEDEKRKMVPNCFTCACPCGRTDAYDMTRLELASGQVRLLKEQLLTGIFQMAAAGQRSDATDRFFYTALFAIGMDDFGFAELIPMVEEMQKLVGQTDHQGKSRT